MNRIQYPNYDAVVYLEADVNYTIFHLGDGKQIISSSSLKRHEADYQKNHFLRVNKSFLLNPQFIKNFLQNGRKGTIVLENGTQIPVSRRKIGLVKSELQSFEF